jgi:hypothetical protein
MSVPHAETGSLPPCPGWCDGSHAANYPVHSVEVGQVELAGDVALGVSLFARGGQPVTVWLLEHLDANTTVIDLTPEQAHSLYDLLGDALVQAGVEL